MELELDSFSLIDNTAICGMRGKDWAGSLRKKKGLKFTLVTHGLAGILVQRKGFDDTVIPIGWVCSYVPLPGETLEVPKKRAPSPKRVARKTTKVA